MKWLWKDFLVRFVATMLAALAFAFLANALLDSNRSEATPVHESNVGRLRGGAHDPAATHIAIGGIVASLLLAMVGGWKRWNLKMVTVIAMLVSGLYAGDVSIGILCLIFTTLAYLGMAKVHNVVYYLIAPALPPTLDSDPGSQ